MFNFIKNLSPVEVGAILLILIVLFGAKIVTRLAKTGGQSFKEIKKVKKTFTEALEDNSDGTTK
ncbi:MAG: twin-arginine translocase TatA/TatE family subunit [Candidatus Curtissbacteria bacterium]|nr:twin-arginine translocase TatA/TatE family subunit [Candidatus Curtissbacteria bacterium]